MNFPGSGKISEASQIRKLCGDVRCVFGMVPSVCMDLLESPLHYVFPYLSSKRNVRRSWVHQNGRLYTCVPTCWPLFLAWKPQNDHCEQTSLQLPCGLLLLPTSEKLTWEGASQIDWYSQPIQYKLHTFIFHHLQLNHLNLLDITWQRVRSSLLQEHQQIHHLEREIDSNSVACGKKDCATGLYIYQSK